MVVIFHVKLVIKVIFDEFHSAAKSGNKSNTDLVVQISCITCCHLLCWIPGKIILLIINFNTVYTTKIFLWEQAFIATLNSILVPLIFIAKKIKTLKIWKAQHI